MTRAERRADQKRDVAMSMMPFRIRIRCKADPVSVYDWCRFGEVLDLLRDVVPRGPLSSETDDDARRVVHRLGSGKGQEVYTFTCAADGADTLLEYSCDAPAQGFLGRRDKEAQVMGVFMALGNLVEGAYETTSAEL